MTSGNGPTSVTISTTPTSASNIISTSNTNNHNNINNNNTNIINNNTPVQQQQTQQLHIQTASIPNNNSSNSNTNSTNNNNNTVTINANGIKRKRFSLNIVNLKSTTGADSSDDVEPENITFTPTVQQATSLPVKEESVAPWQTITEAIQEIPADYVDQSCKQSLHQLNIAFLDIFDD